MKKLVTMLSVLTLSAILAVPLSALPVGGSAAAASVKAAGKGNGLRRQGGAYCCYRNGKKLKNCWQVIGGKKYYFKRNGKAAQESLKIGGKYYVFNMKGQLCQPKSTRTVKIGRNKYCVNSRGMAVKGWSKNRKNFFDQTGKMYTGINVINGKFYCFSSKGTYDKRKTSALRKAAKYEKPFAPVKKIIGEPLKSDYFPGCYVDPQGNTGLDGELTYKNFKVSVFKADNGNEIFMGADPL